jgi:2'-5' RNA ligase
VDPTALEAEKGLIRAFLGIPLPAEQRAALAAYVGACSESHPEFRWVRADNLHLTLRFIGAAEPARLGELTTRLRSTPAPGFELALNGSGSFGSGRLKRVLWLGLGEGAAPAAELAAAVEAACVATGFEADPRPFRAHITLARARDRRGAPEPDLPPAPALPAWRPTEYLLYQSRLGPGGAQYVALERFPLLPGD